MGWEPFLCSGTDRGGKRLLPVWESALSCECVREYATAYLCVCAHVCVWVCMCVVYVPVWCVSVCVRACVCVCVHAWAITSQGDGA